MFCEVESWAVGAAINLCLRNGLDLFIPGPCGYSKGLVAQTGNRVSADLWGVGGWCWRYFGVFAGFAARSLALASACSRVIPVFRAARVSRFTVTLRTLALLSGLNLLNFCIDRLSQYLAVNGITHAFRLHCRGLFQPFNDIRAQPGFSSGKFILLGVNLNVVEVIVPLLHQLIVGELGIG